MKTFAMSNHFNPMEGFDRPRDFHAQARLLKEVGLDGYYYNMGREVTTEKIQSCARACADEGIELAAMYWVPRVSAELFDQELDLFRGYLEAIPDGCPVEMGFTDPSNALAPSSKEGFERSRTFIEAILPDLLSKGCPLSAYPHVNFLIETAAQSLAMVEACGPRGMRAVASAFHSHHAGEDWVAVLSGAPDVFLSVSTCGISEPGPNAKLAIEPLGSGKAIDNTALIGRLRASGYDHWIGLQGYGIQAHSRDILNQSAPELQRLLYT